MSFISRYKHRPLKAGNMADNQISQVNIKTAKHIGQSLAIKSGVIGLLIGYIVFGWVISTWMSSNLGEKLTKAAFWIFHVEFWYHLLIGAIGLLAAAYFFGQLAGVEILIKRKNQFVTGVKYGLITLITGTLIGSSVGFIQEGLDNFGDFSNPFYDYYFKPLYWVTTFGIIPVIIVGLWFGQQIRKRGLDVSMRQHVKEYSSYSVLSKISDEVGMLLDSSGDGDDEIRLVIAGVLNKYFDQFINVLILDIGSALDINVYFKGYNLITNDRKSHGIAYAVFRFEVDTYPKDQYIDIKAMFLINRIIVMPSDGMKALKNRFEEDGFGQCELRLL